MAVPVTIEMLTRCIEAMDTNGDGKCDKGEFRKPFSQATGQKLTDAEYDKLWGTIDSDKSGNVSVAELASYFGYEIQDGQVIQKKENNDDDILKLLQMSADAYTEEPTAVGSAPAAPPLPIVVERVKQINPSRLPADSIERMWFEECQLGEIDKVSKLCDEMQERCITLRLEDMDGKMALHYLAREGDKAIHLIRKIVEQGGETKKDVNYPCNKDGKTPLHFAVEYKQRKLVDMLLNLGADPLRQTKAGWTILHSAVFTRDDDLVKMILNHERVRDKKDIKKSLVSSTTIDMRTALHIASYRSDGDIVKFLLDCGSDPNAIDSAGNKAVCLAEKTGRRKSKDILEAHMNK